MRALHMLQTGRRLAFPLARPLCTQATLSHVDAQGDANMVDVSSKMDTARTAVALATVQLGPTAFSALSHGTNAKGNVLAAARIAGIMAAKRTSDLIPLCHPLSLSHVAVQMSEVRRLRLADLDTSSFWRWRGWVDVRWRLPECQTRQLPLPQDPASHALHIEASATCRGNTGVEMEALTAASVAALTVYDMCKVH